VRVSLCSVLRLSDASVARSARCLLARVCATAFFVGIPGDPADDDTVEVMWRSGTTSFIADSISRATSPRTLPDGVPRPVAPSSPYKHCHISPPQPWRSRRYERLHMLLGETEPPSSSPAREYFALPTTTTSWRPRSPSPPPKLIAPHTAWTPKRPPTEGSPESKAYRRVRVAGRLDPSTSGLASHCLGSLLVARC
jgi:hypothetical protein